LTDKYDEEPVFKAPPKSCDCHFHVFGLADRYPYASNLRYVPPLAPLEDYLSLTRRLGIERYVFVQPSAYGQDNACMLDAMRKLGTVCRGIVDVDENISETELGEMNKAGVRGIRVNVSPVKLQEADVCATLLPRIRFLNALCAEMGWQIDFLTPGWLTSELMDTFKTLKVDFTIAHMGMFLAKDGIGQRGFQQLLDLLRFGEGHCWVKLTGVYRMSTTLGFVDAEPMAHALLEVAPNRVIWGSDFPHLSFTNKVHSIELFNLLGHWAPDEEIQRTILVENPQQLFKF